MAFRASRAILASSSTSRAAPPIRKPSTSGWEMSSAAFFEVTDPPYRIRTLSDTFVPKVVFKSLRMAFAASWADCGVAVSYTHLDVYKRQAGWSRLSSVLPLGSPMLRDGSSSRSVPESGGRSVMAAAAVSLL